MILIFIQGHNFMRIQKLLCSFSCNFFRWVLMKCTMLPHHVGLLRLIPHEFGMISVKGENSDHTGDFIRYALKIDQHLDACKLISFKLGVILDIKTKMYSFFFPNFKYLDLHSKSQAYETARTWAVTYCRVAWRSTIFVCVVIDGLLCEGDDYKEVL